MINLQVTAFHLDFSTLDIEKGKVDISPSGSTSTIQPIIISPIGMPYTLSIEEDKDSKAGMFVKADFEQAWRISMPCQCKGCANPCDCDENYCPQCLLDIFIEEQEGKRNPDITEAIRCGFADVAQGKVSKIDISSL